MIILQENQVENMRYAEAAKQLANSLNVEEIPEVLHGILRTKNIAGKEKMLQECQQFSIEYPPRNKQE